jgi:hypothetical protein
VGWGQRERRRFAHTPRPPPGPSLLALAGEAELSEGGEAESTGEETADPLGSIGLLADPGVDVAGSGLELDAGGDLGGKGDLGMVSSSDPTRCQRPPNCAVLACLRFSAAPPRSLRNTFIIRSGSWSRKSCLMLMVAPGKYTEGA